MKKNGPSEETMSKVKQQLIKQRETALKTNEFWAGVLSNMWLQNDGAPPIYDMIVVVGPNDDHVHQT
jgi:hypothetical protein